MIITAFDTAKQLLYDGLICNYDDITNLKLQKLIYFANLTYLSITGKPLFSDNVKAWKLGPVVGVVYHEYKTFGNRPIQENIICSSNNILLEVSKFVMEVFGRKSATELVNITHDDPIYDKAKERSNKVMIYNQQDAINVIQKEMKSLAERAAYASLKGKLYPNEFKNLPPYVDDYKDVSEEERKKIWGISD